MKKRILLFMACLAIGLISVMAYPGMGKAAELDETNVSKNDSGLINTSTKVHEDKYINSYSFTNVRLALDYGGNEEISINVTSYSHYTAADCRIIFYDKNYDVIKTLESRIPALDSSNKHTSTITAGISSEGKNSGTFVYAYDYKIEFPKRVDISNGCIDYNASNSYSYNAYLFKNEYREIVANVPSGYVFVKWELSLGSTATVENETSPVTNLIMGGEDVTVTARCRSKTGTIPSGGSTPTQPGTASGYLFSDHNYEEQMTGSPIVIYDSTAVKPENDEKAYGKVCTLYTNVLASYKYTYSSSGKIKPSAGRVIVGITKSDVKPELDSKNRRIIDTSASKIAKAKIKNGQITITSVGKESGLVYLWVMDTGSNGTCLSYPIQVKIAPKRLEVQDESGSKLTDAVLENGGKIEVCIAGIVSKSKKTNDGTYTAIVDSGYKDYISVAPVDGSTDKFSITANELEKSEDIKVSVTFQCDQNGKKIKFPITIAGKKSEMP